MGFLQAMSQMGQFEHKDGLASYLVMPMEREGKEIRVWLKVIGDLHEPLQIEKVSRIDLADYHSKIEYLKRYLYRARAGSAANWTYSPVHKAGKMKNNADKNLELLCGPGWEKDKDTHFFKIKNRMLLDYEKQGFFTPGSVERIMTGMEASIKLVVNELDNKQSYIIVFGIEQEGDFLYPGEVPAFINYFEKKLNENLFKGKNQKQKELHNQYCSLCGKSLINSITMDKIFKFATFDKVSVLPGLDKNEISYSYPLCPSCFENISAGREKVDRVLANASVLPDIRIWAIPEAVGNETQGLFQRFLHSWEESFGNEDVSGSGEKREHGYFSRLAKAGFGMSFHFVFWQRNNAQEIIHLMVEDVPPERLARLQSVWQKVSKSTFGWKNETDLDTAIRSLYATLAAFAGKSSADKIVFRDFALEVIGDMLQGQALPVDMFKRFIVPRLPRLVYEGNPKNTKRTMRYAELWVEYMQAVNMEVMN